MVLPLTYGHWVPKSLMFRADRILRDYRTTDEEKISWKKDEIQAGFL